MLRWLGLAFLLCDVADAVEPLFLRVGPRAGLEVTEADGVWTLTTTGANPHFWTSVIPGEAGVGTHPILSFEYFATAPVPNLQVRVPFAEGAAHLRAGAVPLAETWRDFSVDLRLAQEPYASGPGKQLALILGTEVGHRFQIRQLQLRPANEEEARSAAEREEQSRLREVEAEAWLAGLRRPYAGRITQVAVEAERIVVRADIEGPLRVGREAPAAGRTIARFDGMRDRSVESFQIVDEQGAPLTPPAYASVWTGQRELRELKAKGIKGLGGIPMNLTPDHEIFSLGIEHATVNIVVNALLRPDAAPGWAPWEFEGRKIYLNAGYLRSLDATVRTLSQKQVIVSAILLVGNHRDAAGRPLQPMVHPDALAEGTFAMPDLVTSAGTALYRAVIHQLTDRYTRENGEFGRISNWILHNEVNQAGTWTNMGEQPLARYLEAYLRSCRLVYQSARRFDRHARVFISLTHHWTELSGGPQTYVVRDLLELFAEAAWVEGDFAWGVAYHPYPQPMRQPDAWANEVSYEFSAKYITPKNIEVLPAFLAQERFLYQGKPRGILLSEQGINAVSLEPEEQRRQAAGIVYTMERVRRLPGIEAFHYHAYRDAPEAEGGLLLGLTNPQAGHKLAWDVYAAMGTEREAAAFSFAWPILGVAGPEAPELAIRPVTASP